MRITEAYSRLVEQTAQTNAVRPAEKTKQAPATEAADGQTVKVSVSAKARELADRAEAGMDEARVARLRAAIQDGSFAIDPRTIADRIVQKG